MSNVVRFSVYEDGTAALAVDDDGIAVFSLATSSGAAVSLSLHASELARVVKLLGGYAAQLTAVEPDREPSADQERAWDERDDERRRSA